MAWNYESIYGGKTLQSITELENSHEALVYVGYTSFYFAGIIQALSWYFLCSIKHKTNNVQLKNVNR